MLEVHSETVRGSECGVAVENWANSWKTSLKNVARQFHTEAMKSGGQFAALVLDPDGRMLDVAQMVQHKGKNSISHLLILLGGPGGISQADSDDLQTVFVLVVDFVVFLVIALALLVCSLLYAHVYDSIGPTKYHV